jgi:hypothetical protein
VVDAALAQIPEHLHRRDAAGRIAVLVRTDGAGATKGFATHLAARRAKTRRVGRPAGPARPLT